MRRNFSINKFGKFRNSAISEASEDRPCIVISAGTCGQASGANDIIRVVKKHILQSKLQDKIAVRITGC